MSQFLLAQGVESSMLPRWASVVPALADEFLAAASAEIFGEGAIADVVTVIANDEDFDAVFVRAQREMIEGRNYENTKLSELLDALSRSAERVALWYGSDYVDLKLVHDLEGLTRIVRDGLLSSSVEAYALLVRA